MRIAYRTCARRSRRILHLCGLYRLITSEATVSKVVHIRLVSAGRVKTGLEPERASWLGKVERDEDGPRIITLT